MEKEIRCNVAGVAEGISCRIMDKGFRQMLESRMRRITRIAQMYNRHSLSYFKLLLSVTSSLSSSSVIQNIALSVTSSSSVIQINVRITDEEDYTDCTDV